LGKTAIEEEESPMARILVVDDDADIRTLIEVVLGARGHDVRSVSNGEQALRSIRRRAPDVVLLDLMMPDLDGATVLERMREMPSRADVPVIIVTAKHDPKTVVRELAGGAVDHLTKPFLPSELDAAIQRALDPSPEASMERRRILSTDAEMYASVGELVALARAGG
jgi:CheY-like chemotaxis protein